jgi:hypothetical protein
MAARHSGPRAFGAVLVLTVVILISSGISWGATINDVYNKLLFLEYKVDLLQTGGPLPDVMDALADIEGKLDALGGAPGADGCDLTGIEAKLDNIEGKLDSGSHGLAALADAINGLEGKADAAEGKLDAIIAGGGDGGTCDLTAIEAKLDVLLNVMGVDDGGTVIGILESLENKADAAEGKLDNLDGFLQAALLDIYKGELNIEGKLDQAGPVIGSIEAKLDGLVAAAPDLAAALGAIENKLDDETRFTDDTELAAVSTAIDAIEAKIDNPADGGIVDTLATMEGKLDNLPDPTAALAAIELKLDDAGNGLGYMESKLDTVQTNTGDILTNLANAETKLDNLPDPTAALGAIENKLDDETRFTDDTELAAVSTAIDAIEAKIDNPADGGIVDTLATIEGKLDNLPDPTAALADIEGKLDALDVTGIEAKLDTIQSDTSYISTGIDNLFGELYYIEDNYLDYIAGGVDSIESKMDDFDTGDVGFALEVLENKADVIEGILEDLCANNHSIFLTGTLSLDCGDGPF